MVIKMAEKKLIQEYGFVLGKEIKEATNEFVSRDGVVIPAQPTRYIVHVITSSLVDDEDGMSYMTRIDFKFDNIEEYKKFKYLTKVVAVFEYTVTDKVAVSKPIKLSLAKN